MRLIPSGILHAGVKSFIANGVVVSLEALRMEIDELISRGVPVFERLRISEACPLVLPVHVALDEARELSLGDQKMVQQSVGLVQHMKTKLHVEQFV